MFIQASDKNAGRVFKCLMCTKACKHGVLKKLRSLVPFHLTQTQFVVCLKCFSLFQINFMRCNLLFTPLFASLIVLGSCNKEGAENNPRVENDSLLQTGPMSGKLGRQINLNGQGYPNSSSIGNYWGRDFNELFVTTGSLLRIDLLGLKVEELEKSGGLFTGKDGNSGIVFLGTLNGGRGYYNYKFATNAIEKIMSVSRDQGTSLQMAGNAIFFRTGTAGAPTNPCEGNDFICSDNPSVKMSTTYHLDKVTKRVTSLPQKLFKKFSKDGTKTILVDSFDFTKTYIFDNTTHSYIDSFVASYYVSDNNEWGDTYYDDNYKSYSMDINGEVVERDVKTGQEQNRFPLPIINPQLIKVSPDGTKLLYKGLSISNSESIIIGVYDMLTRTDKVIATFSAEEGDRIDAQSMKLSDDNKRLLIMYDSDLYIRDLD